MHICSYFNLLSLRFLSWKRGGGGGSDGLSLRFIFFLLHGLWGENRLWVLPIRLYRVRLTQCSCVDAFVVDLVIHGCAFYGSTSFKMSTRRLPVILFVSRFECPFYPVVYCMMCLWWPRRFMVSLRQTACQCFTTFSESFTYYPPPGVSIGYPPTYRSRLCKGCYVNWFCYHISYLCYMSVCCPSPAGYQSGPPKVRRPWTPTRCNCWRKPYVPGSGCSRPVSSGAFRYPP